MSTRKSNIGGGSVFLTDFPVVKAGPDNFSFLPNISGETFSEMRKKPLVILDLTLEDLHSMYYVAYLMVKAGRNTETEK